MKILEFYSIAGHDVTRGESCADLKVPRRDSSRLNVRSPSYTPMHSHCSFLYASIVSPFIVTSNFQRPSRLSLFSSFSSVSYSLYFFLFSFFFFASSTEGRSTRATVHRETIALPYFPLTTFSPSVPYTLD